jgi:hypothetical protein
MKYAPLILTGEDFYAVDIARSCNLPRHRIACYTFGAPRIGNHAHCQMADHLVPEIWHIINDQDVVVKSVKFGGMFKRCGQRVIITDTGRLTVRPSFFEFLLLQVRTNPSFFSGTNRSFCKTWGQPSLGNGKIC